MTPEAVRSRAHALPEIARYAWEERAAIMEFDGGRSRPDAERLAIAEILEQERAALCG